MADELKRLPHTVTTRANHVARSVTVTFDPGRTSALLVIERLCNVGLIAVELADPEEWGLVLAEELVPRVADAATLPGRVDRGLRAVSGGRLDLIRVVAALLLLMSGLEACAALIRGGALPWLRALTYLLSALSLGSRGFTPGAATDRIPRGEPGFDVGERKRDGRKQPKDGGRVAADAGAGAVPDAAGKGHGAGVHRAVLG